MSNENSLLDLELGQNFGDNNLDSYLNNNPSMQQFFTASGPYDDEGDRYEGTQWYNR